MKEVSTDSAALRVSLAFPKSYLAAEDLRGSSRTVVIANVEALDLPVTGGSKKKEKKIVVTLEGKKKQWVLNKTCARMLLKLHGDEMRGWVGKSVELYPTTCDAFGEKNVPCVRVRAAK